MSRKLFVMAAMVMVTMAAVGQDFKIGYTNIDAIVFNMPEIAGINSELEVQEKQLASMVNSKRTEINTKVQQLQAMAQDPNAVQLVLQERENEVRRMSSDLESFQVQVQQAYAKKQADLLNPVYVKVQTAIDEVRKEKGYAMILNAQISGGGGIVLAANDDDNITEAVFAKLGVPMPKEANGEGAPTATTATGAGN